MPHFPHAMLAAGLLIAAGCAEHTTDPGGVLPVDTATVAGTITVTAVPGTVINADAPRLLGITFDGLTNARLGGSGTTPAGLYDPATGGSYPGVTSIWNAFPIAGARYPGNMVNQQVNWKYDIGPVANRPPQLLAFNTPLQRVAFGFDEFMAMTAARGTLAADVQIMVWIYPTPTEPDPAGSAADLVEYANAPNNGSNPRGGTDWAAVRAANGHAAPYGIRIWNIGNEPWATGELNFNANAYLPIALPIINAMLAADPTIHITIPSVGAPSSGWNSVLFASTTLRPKIWGFSPHFFYDEDAATPSPSIAESETLLRSMATAASAIGLHVVIGDHAGAIQLTNGNASTVLQDQAMQWQGAVTTAAFLLMASQVGNVDRANFWEYGLPAAQWHPIRLNANGSYTLMPVAALYEALTPVFLKEALATTTKTSASSPLMVRSAVFRSASGNEASEVIVNHDLAVDHTLTKPVLAGFHVTRARLLSASGPLAETFVTTTVTAAADGRYAIPHSSVLILDWAKG